MANQDPDPLTEIVSLQRQVSALIEIVEHLYTLAGSTQRFSDQQEKAFKEIPKLLKHAKNPVA